MPSSGLISCHMIKGSDPNARFPELLPTATSEGLTTCYVPVGTNSKQAASRTASEQPYAVHWSIEPALLRAGGLQVQIEVDGCQKGQPRCYEGVGPDGLVPASSLSGMDNGLWVVPDGTRRRPWILGPIKTTHPHSALADKYILDRVGSVHVTFRRATVVPTSRIVPLVPVFNGSAPLPDRMQEKLSHWTKLGLIEKHKPAPELGLVADDVHELLASFTFYYRSSDILQRLLPLPSGKANSRHSVSSDVKFAFPSSPGPVMTDTGSMHSAELMSTSLSDGHAAPTPLGKTAGAFRRAFSNTNHPRHSLDNPASATPEKTLEKEDGPGRFGKLGGKRVRAVSLKVAKRYSFLAHKPGEKNPSHPTSPLHDSSPLEAIPNIRVANGDDADLDTLEGLKTEVFLLRAEVTKLKGHLNL